MASSSLPNHDGPSCGNPYKVLNLETGATDAEISKAYRLLARTYHPDKQTTQKDSEKEKIAQKFLNIKEAKNFLLDSEHAEARRKYDAKLASDAMRRKEDERRSAGMTEKRKTMRESLARKEKSAAVRSKKKDRRGFVAGRTEEEEERLEKLRREGDAARERYEDKAAREEARERVKRTIAVEERQVRLKWSRKKMKSSHSDDSISILLKKFGAVESVELIGGKGNAALVTFFEKESCGPCVDAYLDSDEMRASFVGQRKQDELRRTFASSSSEKQRQAGSEQQDVPDFESVSDSKMRRASEREALLRKMEMEEEQGHDTNDGAAHFDSKSDDVKTSANKDIGISTTFATTYPPPFPPATGDELGFTPLQRLEKLERMVLPKCVSSA